MSVQALHAIILAPLQWNLQELFTIMAHNMHHPKGEQGWYSTKDSCDELHNRLCGSRAQASPHCNCYTWRSTFTQTLVSPAVWYLYPFGCLELHQFSELGYHVSPQVIFQFNRQPVFFLHVYHDSSGPWQIYSPSDHLWWCLSRNPQTSPDTFTLMPAVHHVIAAAHRTFSQHRWLCCFSHRCVT